MTVLLSWPFRKGAPCAGAAMVLVGCTGPLGASNATRPPLAAPTGTTASTTQTAQRTPHTPTKPATITADVAPRSQPNPTPPQDDLPGSRLRVTVAGGCPASDRGIVGVSNTRTHLEDKLLPADPPVNALICRYSGSQGAAYQLAEHHLVAASTARRLADLAGWVQLSYDSRNPVQSCAAGDGTRTVVCPRLRRWSGC